MSIMNRYNANINHVNRHGESALTRAAKTGATVAIEALMARGALGEWEDASGFTPLGHSVQESQLEASRALVRLGCEVNRAGQTGDTPLMIASRNGDVEMVQCLVDLKAWVDYESATQENALCLAARHDHMQLIEYLVHRGANPNFIKQDRLTPLMYACKHGAIAGVAKLCDVKADPDFQLPPGNIAITIAAEGGFTETVKALINGGANVEMETLNGATPLIRGAMLDPPSLLDPDPEAECFDVSCQHL